jgi:Ran GTPase-activating protein (RanGAP) involved in mRNA processing and transport
VLDLGDNNLGKGFLKRFLQALENVQSLESLSLANNKFGTDCDELFHSLIREVSSIRYLNLSFNPLKDQTLIRIADAMLLNTSIIWLELSETMMGDASAQGFAVVIAQNSTLQELYLNSNRITDASAVDIAKAIAKNQALTRLAMKRNEMKDETAQFMMESLDQNTTLLDLDVDLNDFGYRAHVQLIEAIAAHKKYLIMNFADIATRHIEILKRDEKRLFQVRDDVRGEMTSVESSIEERETKEKLLANLTVSREQQIQEATARLDQVTQAYNAISEERSNQCMDFNRMKGDLESARSEVLGEFQMVATKRQHAQARVTRAENKRLEAEIQVHRTLDDLKIHLLTIKEQLRHAIEETHAAQDTLIQREAKEKAREQALALAQELLRAEQREKEKGGEKSKILTVNERRKVKKTTERRRTSSPNKIQRPKTAAGAPVVTPVFDGETGKP